MKRIVSAAALLAAAVLNLAGCGSTTAPKPNFVTLTGEALPFGSFTMEPGGQGCADLVTIREPLPDFGPLELWGFCGREVLNKSTFSGRGMLPDVVLTFPMPLDCGGRCQVCISSPGGADKRQAIACRDVRTIP